MIWEPVSESRALLQESQHLLRVTSTIYQENTINSLYNFRLSSTNLEGIADQLQLLERSKDLIKQLQLNFNLHAADLNKFAF